MRPSSRGTSVPPLIAIGASAGGIEALRVVLPSLPAELPAAVAVVVHRAQVQEDDRLTQVLAIDARLAVRTVTEGALIERGCVYVCPAGVHLAVQGRRFALTTGPRENRSRPAIDVLFRTAAEGLGPRAAGVLLSGMLDDGTAGLAAIKARGGYAVVQDPDEAAFGDMPRNAMENVAVDAVLRLDAMAEALTRFAQEAGSLSVAVAIPPREELTEPSLFSCPDCGGVLSHVEADGVVRFRCRTGHAYSPRTLFSEQEHGLEEALWVALRALVERTDLSERLAKRSRRRGFLAAAHRFDQQAAVARRRAEVVRAAMETPQSAIDAAVAAADIDDAAGA
ncbi:MAG TPA: chemotaxis protein CheB [Candidatus Elarobacter sp.]